MMFDSCVFVSDRIRAAEDESGRLRHSGGGGLKRPLPLGVADCVLCGASRAGGDRGD